jgi:hypothetical protein
MYRFLPVSEAFRWENWASPWIVAGALAGAIIGHALWVVAKPRQRASRAAAVCVLANVLVWLSFLTFTPPLDNAEFSRVDKERVQRDAEPGRLDFVTDQPTVVAARWHGTFGAVNSLTGYCRFLRLPRSGSRSFWLCPRATSESTRRNASRTRSPGSVSSCVPASGSRSKTSSALCAACTDDVPQREQLRQTDSISRPHP